MTFWIGLGLGFAAAAVLSFLFFRVIGREVPRR